RIFYFGRKNTDDTENEAWAIGGWLEYRSGWLYDTLAIGAVGYTSQPLYAPDDRDGTAILAPGQEGVTGLRQALRPPPYKECALLTGYRQLVNDGYVNPQDNRMNPYVLILACTLGASSAFMMPVGTPPNAIVFGTGLVRLPQMMWAGFWLNLAGILVITALVTLRIAPLLGTGR